ncbi:MAG: ABC transporter permease [Candidatus Loosdrechtia sp.]|uniref:ABC transporter permease n=1 Tax=Candidatus Loosdrechtia sp. TaxID=3101272 RepID=UPI003A7A3696|nr:MAG: ABC transporter permease [Candidatus Jettenia sp. AMX2]
MISISTIFQKEINSYFLSPVAYVIIAVFTIFSGYFFSIMLGITQETTLRYSLSYTQFILSVLTPVITMRLLAEENKTGTIEPLMTAPVTDFEVVFGKFLSAWALYNVMIAPTAFYILFLAWVGSPDYGAIIASYIGLVLMGGLFISIGLLVSAVTKNQIVAAVIGIVALLILLVIGLASTGSEGWFYSTMRYIGTYDHWDTFTKGIIDTRDVIYYVSFTALLLFIVVRIVESRRWR